MRRPSSTASGSASSCRSKPAWVQARTASRSRSRRPYAHFPDTGRRFADGATYLARSPPKRFPTAREPDRAAGARRGMPWAVVYYAPRARCPPRRSKATRAHARAARARRAVRRTPPPSAEPLKAAASPASLMSDAKWSVASATARRCSRPALATPRACEPRRPRAAPARSPRPIWNAEALAGRRRGDTRPHQNLDLASLAARGGGGPPGLARRVRLLLEVERLDGAFDWRSVGASSGGAAGAGAGASVPMRARPSCGRSAWCSERGSMRAAQRGHGARVGSCVERGRNLQRCERMRQNGAPRVLAPQTWRRGGGCASSVLRSVAPCPQRANLR